MKVYVLTETTGMTFEGDTEVRGVFSTREAAVAAAVRAKGKHWDFDCGVEEHEIDNPVLASSAWGT